MSYNTTFVLNVDGNTIITEIDKTIRTTIDYKTEQKYQIKSTDGWKTVDFSTVENIKFIVFNTPVDETEFKIRMVLYNDIEDEVFAIGDGSTTSFADALTYDSVQTSSVTVGYTLSGTAYTATDDGSGVITGTGLTGTIDYTTGTIALSFSTAPDIDEDITIDYTYLNSDYPTILEVKDIFVYSPADDFEDNIYSIEIATNSTTDVEVDVAVLGEED
jgi:hypothetical protein